MYSWSLRQNRLLAIWRQRYFILNSTANSIASPTDSVFLWSEYSSFEFLKEYEFEFLHKCFRVAVKSNAPTNSPTFADSYQQTFCFLLSYTALHCQSFTTGEHGGIRPLSRQEHSAIRPLRCCMQGLRQSFESTDSSSADEE